MKILNQNKRSKKKNCEFKEEKTQKSNQVAVTLKIVEKKNEKKKKKMKVAIQRNKILLNVWFKKKFFIMVYPPS